MNLPSSNKSAKTVCKFSSFFLFTPYPGMPHFLANLLDCGPDIHLLDSFFSYLLLHLLMISPNASAPLLMFMDL